MDIIIIGIVVLVSVVVGYILGSKRSYGEIPGKIKKSLRYPLRNKEGAVSTYPTNKELEETPEAKAEKSLIRRIF